MSTPTGNYTSNITKLNSSNYEAWRKAITAVLVTLNLWAHVLGTAAVADYASEAEYSNAALRCFSVLVSTIDYSQFGRIHDNDTARALWKRLEEYFRPRGFGIR
ncbi:hypothetical protein EXIGLDRAFT_780357 [Exidia glandulosa HHB12029]|uniref:Retrotransposon Copia-like N-terminal domain-containing protein n=1 Tax=Exidia glandulosa HHB12029 TaxID=1314781 RepID=A0A165ZAQ6_EXIGL|nr:hypothetical protein EXIGLDRAFT_780357 [Exidia glandulosa HHB12029]